MMSKAILIKLVIGVLIYLIFLSDGIEKAIQELNRRSWIPTKGKNIEIILKERSYGVSKKYVSTYLDYSYEIGGKTIENIELLELDKIYPEPASLSELKTWEEKKYKPGADIMIRVNPENKQESTSQPISDHYLMQAIIGILGEIAVCFFILQEFKKHIRPK